MSEMAVYTATPTVRIEGKEYPKVRELIMAMEMTEREGGLSALELRVSNIASDPQGTADLAFETGDILKLGAGITVYCGDQLVPQEVFNGTITGLEAEFSEGQPPELVVLAEDVFQKARMRRRTKTHDNLKIADLASDIAGQLGLKPVVTGLTENVGTQVQLNESDLAFLRRLLFRYDADLQVVGGEMHVSPRADVERGAIELELHQEMRRARVLADLAHQVTEVSVSGWDPIKGKRVSATSKGAQAGVGAGRKGSQILSDTLGGRSEHIGHLALTTAEEARAVADAAFDLRARRFVSVDATVEGNPALRVGTNVKLKGLGPRFDNTYYVTRACHRYDLAGGYETDFLAESAFIGEG